jgi:hypothetical protein
MHVPFVTTVSFADRDGTAVHLQYGVSAGDESEASSEIERRLINQELFTTRFWKSGGQRRAKPLRWTCRPERSSS